MATIKEVIERETKEIEQDAAVSADAHFISERRWDKMHLAFGIPSTILSAIAGVTAFAQQPFYIVGGVAIAGAALSALSTFLSPGDRSASHRAASIMFRTIKREANILRDVDAQLMSDTDVEEGKQLAQRLRELTMKMSEAEQRAPAITASAKDKAERLLKNAGLNVSVRANAVREINQ